MAKKTDQMENKALVTGETGPVSATTEEGARRAAEAAEEAKLGKAEEERLQELSKSGYRIPREWAVAEKETVEHDERIAKHLPSTRDQEHKP